MTQSPSSIEFSTNGDKANPERLAQLTAEHFQNHCQQVWQRTDRMFAGLMALQWLAGIGVALWNTPLTWIGATSSIHLHVGAAIFLGGFWFPRVSRLLSGLACSCHGDDCSGTRSFSARHLLAANGFWYDNLGLVSLD